ncbi:MAG: hypothetical protein ACC645_23215, partial [Pirellulales bacterium]
IEHRCDGPDIQQRRRLLAWRRDGSGYVLDLLCLVAMRRPYLTVACSSHLSYRDRTGADRSARIERMLDYRYKCDLCQREFADEADMVTVADQDAPFFRECWGEIPIGSRAYLARISHHRYSKRPPSVR